MERGYRTGYSDGYSAGSRDLADHAARDFRNSEDYQHADRAFNEAWGTVEDYRDGYQQGFEAGYGAGYDRRQFESSIPAGLSRRGNADAGVSQPAPPESEQNTSQSQQPGNSNVPPSSSPNDPGPPASSQPSGPISLPKDAVLLIELESALSSDVSQRGDRFEARVIDPREFEGAIVEGRVANVRRPGKVKGTAQMQLSFETIRMPNGRTASFNADVVELVNMNSRDAAGSVDSEGGVKGKDSTKDDVSRVGAGAGIGAIIGAIVGGGKGAAIGAVIGGGVEQAPSSPNAARTSGLIAASKCGFAPPLKHAFSRNSPRHTRGHGDRGDAVMKSSVRGKIRGNLIQSNQVPAFVLLPHVRSAALPPSRCLQILVVPITSSRR